MPDYKKHYAFLLYEMDRALTLMENDDLLQWDAVKEILAKALIDVEARVVEEMDELEEYKATENPEIR